METSRIRLDLGHSKSIASILSRNDPHYTTLTTSPPLSPSPSLSPTRSRRTGRKKRSLSADNLERMAFPPWYTHIHEQYSPENETPTSPQASPTSGQAMVTKPESMANTRPFRAMSLPEESYMQKWIKKRDETEMEGQEEDDLWLKELQFESYQENLNEEEEALLANIKLATRKATLAKRTGEITSIELKNIRDQLSESYIGRNKDRVLDILQSLALVEDDQPADTQHRLTPKPTVKSCHENVLPFLKERYIDELKALSWSIDSALRRGVISEQVHKALHGVLRRGAFDDVRDALNHKYYLYPVASLVTEMDSSDLLSPKTAALFEKKYLNTLEEKSQVENIDQRCLKVQTLKELSLLVQKWVRDCGRKKGYSEEMLTLPNGAVFIAGSYRFGLNDPDSDIDIVCLTPPHSDRDRFFKSFRKMLEENQHVTALAAVESAYVPIISIVYRTVPVDILLAQSCRKIVDPIVTNIDWDNILGQLDGASVASINAPRTATLVLSLVPNRKIFRILLRAVRMWARYRGIYSSKQGYLGGISWAILVAYVCQRLPKGITHIGALFAFFQTFYKHPWPRPVLLTAMHDAEMQIPRWNPDQLHLMPIITPTYPQMNCAVHVSPATFSVIMEEFWRAHSVCSEYKLRYSEESKLPRPAFPDPFESIFIPSNFFVRYDWYLAIDIASPTSAALHSWGKFVTSKIRKLVASLQNIHSITRVQAFPKEYPQASTGEKPGLSVYLGLEFYPSAIPGLPGFPNLEMVIRFFRLTDLKLSQPHITGAGNAAVGNLVHWDNLPEFVFENGRAHASKNRYDIRQAAQGHTKGFHPQPMVYRHRPSPAPRSNANSNFVATPTLYHATGFTRQHRISSDTTTRR